FTRPELGLWGNLKNVLNMRSGGLTYYGGFLLAFPAVVLYGVYKKVPLRLGMDIVAPCLMVGLGFGRIGCFLNGCCYGAECDLPCAVQFPYNSYAYQDEFRHGELHPPPQLQAELADGTRTLRPRDQLEAPAELQLARAEHSRLLHPAQLYS